MDLSLRRWDQAIEGYRRVLAEVDRPEFREALGTAFAGAGRLDCAAECHVVAVSAYLASVARGEVHHLHHLAAFHADVHPHSGAAVAWAARTPPSAATGRRCRCSPGACTAPAGRRRRWPCWTRRSPWGPGIPDCGNGPA